MGRTLKTSNHSRISNSSRISNHSRTSNSSRTSKTSNSSQRSSSSLLPNLRSLPSLFVSRIVEPEGRGARALSEEETQIFCFILRLAPTDDSIDLVAEFWCKFDLTGTKCKQNVFRGR